MVGQYHILVWKTAKFVFTITVSNSVTLSLLQNCLHVYTHTPWLQQLLHILATVRAGCLRIIILYTYMHIILRTYSAIYTQYPLCFQNAGQNGR